MITLCVSKRSTTYMMLRLQRYFRIYLAVICLLLGSIIYTQQDINVFILLLALLCVLGLFYQEHWIFDKKENHAIYILRCIIVLKNHHFRLDQITSLFIKKQPYTHRYVRIGFSMHNGDTRLIEIRTKKTAQKIATHIADFLHIPVELSLPISSFE